jgi:hypothetical protein
MADYTSSPRGGGYNAESDMYAVHPAQGKPLAKLTNLIGAAMSVALVVGIGVWGYKLLVRDVTGIPVVRAAQGDMRVRPKNPGGQLAQNQGLSVNAVASNGTADEMADQVILAPKPLDLEDEDQPILVAMVATAPQAAAPIKPTPDVTAALQSGNVEDLVAQLTDGMAPMDDAELEPINASVSIDSDALDMAVSNAIAVAMVAEPGVKASLRPKTRPAVRAVVTPAAFDASASSTNVNEKSADSLPTGTRLVQLGAFDTPEIARNQWDQLNGRFGAYLEGKSRIVQEASSGGRTFYRLRAHGFEDIADARRFCSALVAENADCIPVVTR